MPPVTDIDLTAIPEDQREAVAALLCAHLELKDETAGLKDIVRRLEHRNRPVVTAVIEP